MNKTKIVADACCHIQNAHIRGRSRRGKSACGVLVIDERGNEYEFKRYLGEMTAPESEFNALIFALDQAVSVSRWNVEVWMDSELVIRWMLGEYRMKKEHIKILFDEAKRLSQRFTSVEYFHHSRETGLAKRAHALAEQAFKDNQ
jgi:ribonuclease HI